jgi:hypothetical protein
VARNWLQRELKIQMISLIFTALALLFAATHGINSVAWAIAATAVLAFQLAAPTIRIVHNLMRLAITTIVDGVVYGICLLYLPIPGLATERGHWKARLGLDRFTRR